MKDLLGLLREILSFVIPILGFAVLAGLFISVLIWTIRLCGL